MFDAWHLGNFLNRYSIFEARNNVFLSVMLFSSEHRGLFRSGIEDISLNVLIKHEFGSVDQLISIFV
jgi:hypothetical protein